ncbi:murein biosynthesis integral membrane protein MurJ [Planctomicrobium piriforme]|uniref:Probable lipid II flippase MurJ n=1 Tax=Planctomicrobium piriforme TaxID=1576369 RepID=A0A1I3LYH4_9PLAN|nr:murein biosynthesis integral membrane protein MurJ [Planctomicrobium piriforme]SFI89727.1 putative peptidoglycan lipid II flippase [Planctomicrobium piriforme]
MAEASETDSNEATRSTGTVGVMASLRLVSLGTLLSRVLGLLRDMGMTALFGGGTILDAFIVAFRIPNLARQVLGEGALSTAFLPVFIRSRELHGDLAARQTLTLVTIVLTAAMTAIVIVAELGIMLVCGTWQLEESTRLLLVLLALMLPYALLICLAAVFCAALNALRQFVRPAFVPVVLNAIWLAGMGIVSHAALTHSAQAYWLAVFVTAAGVAQLVLPYFALRKSGMGLVRQWSGGWGDVREIIHSMLPVLIGMSILQASAVFDSFVAWGLSRPDDGSTAWCQAIGITPILEAGTASAIYIGQRMFQFPLGVFGIALGTVLYPVLTQHAQRGQLDLLRIDLSRGLRIVIAVGVPASAGLCIIAWPLTLAMFRHGNFTTEDALLTSRMIGIYGAGVWSYIGVAILNRAWYATGDRLTPMRLGLVALLLNQVLNLTLIWWVGGIGLALGSVISSGVLCLVTLWRLDLHVGPMDWPAIGKTLVKGLFATAVMTVASLAVMSLLPPPTGMLSKLMLLLAPCVTGAVVYLVVSKLTGMSELEELLTKR